MSLKIFYEKYSYLLDPHTAVGVNAAWKFAAPDTPVVCLATAHPAKFGAAVTRAIGRAPALPPGLRGLEEMESRCEVLDPDVKTVQDYIARHSLL